MELWDRDLGNGIKEGTEGCDEEYLREIGKITKCTARELLLGKMEVNIEANEKMVRDTNIPFHYIKIPIKCFKKWNGIFVSRTIFSFASIFTSIFPSKSSRAVHFVIFPISLKYSSSHPSVPSLIPFPKPLSHNSILNLGSIANFYLTHQCKSDL